MRKKKLFRNEMLPLWMLTLLAKRKLALLPVLFPVLNF